MKTFLHNIATGEDKEVRILQTVGNENDYWVGAEDGMPIAPVCFNNELKEKGYTLVCDCMDDRERICSTLRKARTEQGVSVRQMETLTGVNFQNIGMNENGKTSPSIDMISRLASVLGYRLELVPIKK